MYNSWRGQDAWTLVSVDDSISKGDITLWMQDDHLLNGQGPAALVECCNLPGGTYLVRPTAHPLGAP
jgi:hypothetical protein